MALKIGIYNLEKNCGKTTTAVYLAESFATQSNSALLINFSSGEYLKSYLSLSNQEISKAENSLELINKCIQVRKSQSMWRYYTVDTEFNLETFTANLKELEDNFEYIFFDFPSKKTDLDNEILKLLDSIIIPIECEFYGLDNLKNSLEQVLACEGLKVEGILLTKYDSNNLLMPKFLNYLKENFSDIVFNTIISRNYYLGLPQFNIENLNHYIPNTGFADYLKLANEIIEKHKDE